MKNKKIISSISFIAIAFICILGMNGFINKNKEKQEVSYLKASWGYNYSDIQEISTASDLIAMIRVNKLISNSKENVIPFSTFEVQVIDPIYGCEDGETFPIIMTGLQNDKEKIEIIDDPMLEVGQKFLVFTRKNEDGTYKILSGPQGRLEYKDGELNSLQFVNSNVRENNKDMNIKIKNVKAETLTNEIKDNIKENKHKHNK